MMKLDIVRELKEYVESKKEELKKLERFELTKVNVIENILEFNDFESLDLRKFPAVYYFKIHDVKVSNIIREKYLNIKVVTSQIRKNKGLTAEDYLNVSYISKTNLFESDCIYVGSVQNKLSDRLKQHLGIHSKSGRTGALYLKKVLSDLELKIDFCYYKLDKEEENIRKHIECILFDKLKPIIGKRAL